MSTHSQPAPGSRVKIQINKKGALKDIEGILMPTDDDAHTFVKLDSGYNLGVENKSIVKIQTISALSSKPTTAHHIPLAKNLPTITLLHTGGTIASKVDYESGGVTAKYSAHDLLQLVPELATIANIKTELVANIMSEDMNFSDYHKIIAGIKKHAADCDGIIIGHGTDTLGYTAAALAFALETISIPVILVGSQRSSDRGSTDAAANLICAAQFITQTNFAGVAICMHHTSSDDVCAILPPTKTRKMHTSRRDAFQPINAAPIALVHYPTGKVDILATDYARKSAGTLMVQEKFSPNIGLLKVHPSIKPELVEFFAKNYAGIVIEGTGLGHAPTNTPENLKNYETLKKYIKQGGIVAITSQCLYGRVHPSVYTNLRRLAEIGCIFCEDMLPETAYIKLAWLLGNYSADEAKIHLAKNMRGEITERSEYEEEFLKMKQ
ncbi:MAG: Glu-tRNA(Gln) amidotransferase subunit GatD [Candidatus Woesearchaeota archaeon]|nr:Glu-tRNA(Gln) amidotransferase subunit GatD [Candidatus Woesearchaeota archaeon]